jgi:GH25 family lysozyme M1 (1,4-beta-N-acetylmuramidase)
MAWGMYHFLRPGSMQAQADFFAKIAKQNGDRDTLICCDFEVAGIALAEVAEFMRIISDMGQRSAVLYTGHSLKDALIAGEDGDELKQYRLWLAQYCEGEPDLPQGWDRWWLWQYSQSGEIEGIMAPTDVNAYDGEAEQLLREWSGSGREPRPPMPEPVTVAMTLTIDAPPGIAVTVNGQAV